MKFESQDNWVLYSERALDTLCLCGLRGRPSRGKLESSYKYFAVDDLEVVLHRPVLAGEIEEITQGDLDVLRAAITHYIFKYDYDTQRASDKLLEKDSEELCIVLTPGDIRERLLLTKDDLPTHQITRSLHKLSSLEVQANYRLRIKGGSEAIPIQGTLFSLHIAPFKPGSQRVGEYTLWFETDWGMLFMHNIRCGNLVVIRDVPYQELDNTAKNLFFPIMSMSNPVFVRRQDKLLGLIHNGDGQNLPRAIARMESKLKALERYGLLTWKFEKGVYRMRRLYDPIKGRMPRDLGSAKELEGEGLDLEVTKGLRKEEQSLDIGKEIIRLLNIENPSEWENIQCDIIESVMHMNEKLKGRNLEMQKAMKPTLIRRYYSEYSPYYLWIQDKFRMQAGAVEPVFKYGNMNGKVVFERIDSDPKLQQDLKEWLEKVESFYNIHQT